MKIRSCYNAFIFFAVIAAAFLVALDFFPVIKPAGESYAGFSAGRAAADIKFISSEPHSIEHPAQRKVVREYLYDRLRQLGSVPRIMEYDSVICKFGGTFDIANVYAKFDPPQITGSTQYVLLVAHLDSRFHNVVKKDTVYSYGAADDGYGLAVILESVGQAVKYRSGWKQGIKVLFTDSEEHELDGMRNALEKDKDLFDNVNFVINVEARGVKGPALLFETSRGNAKVMELYKRARRPCTYSLTTLVYRVLPNDTDFSCIKDSLPGFNFAVIDDLHYYHTNRDCYANISLRSLQHYGMQIEPIMHDYLTNKKYSGPDSLRSGEDRVFFTVPLLGLFDFTRGSYILLNLITFFLFATALFLYIKAGKARLKKIIRYFFLIAGFVLLAAAAGEGLAWMCARLSGLEFNMVSVKYVEYDYLIIIGMIVLAAVLIVRYITGHIKKDSHFVYDFLFGALLFCFTGSALLLVFVLENFFLAVPLLAVSVALLLSIFRGGRIFYLISSVLIVLLGGSFLYRLVIALTIGSLGIFLALASVYLVLLLSQYGCYKRNLL